MILARGRASKDGELEETTLPRLEVWEESNLGKSTLSEVRSGRCPGAILQAFTEMADSDYSRSKKPEKHLRMAALGRFLTIGRSALNGQ